MRAGYKIADISFDASDPWDASLLENSELVLFKVPADFPTLQLSGKKIELNSTLKIRNENERSSYTIQDLDDLGELDQMRLIAADSKTRSFKIVDAPKLKYCAIRPKIAMPSSKSRKRDSPESVEKKSKKKKSRSLDNK